MSTATLKEVKRKFGFTDNEEIHYEKQGEEVIIRMKIHELNPAEESKRFWTEIDEGEKLDITEEEIVSIVKKVRAKKRVQNYAENRA